MVITEEKLASALYSINKRALKYRNKKRNGSRKAEEAEKNLYAKKDELLSITSPDYVIKEFLGYARERVYETDDDYVEKLIEHAFTGDICWNKFSQNEVREVLNFDYETDRQRYTYYKAYVINGFVFRSPVFQWELPELPIVTINRVISKPEDVKNLMSMEEIDAMIDAIKSGDYEFTKTSAVELPDDDVIPPRTYDLSQIKWYWPAIARCLKHKVPADEVLFADIRNAASFEGYSRDLCERYAAEMAAAQNA